MEKESEIQNLTSKIVELIDARAVPADYWNAAQCAAYARLATRSFNDYVAVLPKFPKPIRPTGENGNRIWLAESVKEYFRIQHLRAQKAS